MSNHRDSKKGDACTTTTVTLCNGALTVVKELQSKYFSEHSRYLSTPRAINMLLQQIKSEDKCRADAIKEMIVVKSTK